MVRGNDDAAGLTRNEPTRRKASTDSFDRWRIKNKKKKRAELKRQPAGIIQLCERGFANEENARGSYRRREWGENIN